MKVVQFLGTIEGLPAKRCNSLSYPCPASVVDVRATHIRGCQSLPTSQPTTKMPASHVCDWLPAIGPLDPSPPSFPSISAKLPGKSPSRSVHSLRQAQRRTLYSPEGLFQDPNYSAKLRKADMAAISRSLQTMLGTRLSDLTSGRTPLATLHDTRRRTSESGQTPAIPVGIHRDTHPNDVRRYVCNQACLRMPVAMAKGVQKFLHATFSKSPICHRGFPSCCRHRSWS